ncbi:DUF6477 family protein [Thalassococcus sp. S3]|uniref:DUF6477 family protein n=1 Tax=Thalassococcus sp. S3 TaxID=2017482 RepID=UPI00102463EC|nr:DUF6477 family protein [Thalassococcus sp. S3]QBF31725.1 hypothetical protein CFI11_10905 [Thalassococcus sp. S3]
MQDLIGMMAQLRRPRLLIRAARLGADDYRRERHLQRLLGYGGLPRSGTALIRLMEMERALNAQRKEDDASYSLTRHLDILIAMMGEARILRASQAERQLEALT